MEYNLLILVKDSNMPTSGDVWSHFPYELLHAFMKLGINASMTGLEDAAYLRSYGINYSLLQANLLLYLELYFT